MRINARGLATAGLVGALAITGLTACGGSSNNYSGRMPAGYPVINGVTYCGWVMDPLECSDSGIPAQFWVQMPANGSSYNAAMYNNPAMFYVLLKWHQYYHGYYAAPAYYNHYVPKSKRSSYTKVYLVSFNKANKAAFKKYDKSKSSTIPGVKTAKPATPFSTKNNGGKVNKTIKCAAGLNSVVVAEVPELALGRTSGGGGHSSSHSGGGSKSGSSKSGKSGSSKQSTSGGATNGGSTGGLPGTGSRKGGKSQGGC
jgi:hypothetical protein